MKQTHPIQFSYEFFPPRSDEMVRRLWRAVGQLERLDPVFFSMTYGALGSNQQISVDTAIAMHRESPVAVTAHLTCADACAIQIDRVAQQFYDAGIRRIVALRGDAVGDPSSAPQYGYTSTIDLVEALRNLGDIDISVAAYPETHPQADSALADLQHLKNKLDAGANRAITQYFFDVDCFLRFRDQAQCCGIEKPIVPGILPVHDFQRVKAFSEQCGATVPASYEEKFAAFADDPESQYCLSLELAVSLCEKLNREGVNHIHLYTLNQTDMCLDISLALGASLNPLRINSAA